MFLVENIADAKMRERVILSLIDRNDYTKVLQLSIDGQPFAVQLQLCKKQATRWRLNN